MPDEKGFRTVKCGGEKCGKVLRFAITVAMYGKTVIIRCPDCKSEGRVTIPQPAKAAPTTRPFDPKSAEELFKEFFGGADSPWPKM